MGILRQSACLVVNPITVNSCGFLLLHDGGSGLRLIVGPDVFTCSFNPLVVA